MKETNIPQQYGRINKATNRFTVHWFLLCIVVPMMAIAGNAAIHIGITLLFPAAVIIYCGSRLAAIAAKGIDRIVEMTFWLYAYIFMGICAFMQIEAGRFPWGGHYSDRLMIISELIVLIGLAVFDFGKRLKIKSIIHARSAPRRQFEVSRNRLYFMSVIGMSIAVYATMKLGAFSTLFLNRSANYAIISARYSISQLSIYTSLAKTIVYVLLIAALAYRIQKKHSGALMTILIVVLSIFTAVENNPISTPRFQVGTILISVFFIFSWRKYKASLVIYALVFGMIVVFPYASLYRNSNSPSLEAKIAQFRKANPLVLSGDYDSFQQVMNGVRMVQNYGLTYGHQISSAFLFWVPRKLWPEKAEPTGVLIAERSGYSFTNLSAPLWVEFYVDGGGLLVLLGFFFYGRLVRGLDLARQNSDDRLRPIYLFATIYAGYQIFLLRGSLMPAIAYLSPVLPIILACSILHKNSINGNSENSVSDHSSKSMNWHSTGAVAPGP